MSQGNGEDHSGAAVARRVVEPAGGRPIRFAIDPLQPESMHGGRRERSGMRSCIHTLTPSAGRRTLIHQRARTPPYDECAPQGTGKDSAVNRENRRGNSLQHTMLQCLARTPDATEGFTEGFCAAGTGAALPQRMS
jgi:hypothetical protein